MRLRRGWIALLFVAATCTPVGAQPAISPGADAWVIAADIAPFTLSGASVRVGQTGLYSEFVPPDPENVDAGAGYKDAARGMKVYVRVVRQGNPAHLHHFLEAPFRSHQTGRMHSESSMIEHAGHAVLFYCSPVPVCRDRTYAWRSGADVVVQIEAKAFVDVGTALTGPDPRRTTCPEPTEILNAYTDRYPSALTMSSDDDTKAKQWLRYRVGLELGRTELLLAEVSTVAEELRKQALFTARNAFVDWAEQRQKVYGKPDAMREAERMAKIANLQVDAQLRELSSVRDEYRAWWSAHQNDPIQLPPP